VGSHIKEISQKQPSIKYEQTKIILKVNKIKHLKEKFITIFTTDNLNVLFLVDGFEVLQQGQQYLSPRKGLALCLISHDPKIRHLWRCLFSHLCSHLMMKPQKTSARFWLSTSFSEMGSLP
jgi:hypothetical protein